MKKILIFFFTFATLFSCESTNTETRIFDPIIGTWRLTSMTLDGKEADTRTACEKRSTSTFLENGTTTINNFYDGNDNGNDSCESANGTSIWENLGNSIYKVQDDGETTEINFSENNTIFSVSKSEIYNSTTYTITFIYRKQ